MDFTGERYVPSVRGRIQYEHLHRYALSLQFAAGKTIVDIASGEGYGAALLASVAESVTGVDLDPTTVAHARQNYCRPNLRFISGSCESVPLSDGICDVVTSFETIEHHNKHEEMLSEIHRMLKPDGVLIISSPNRLTYSDLPNYHNPFHVKELYFDEFRDLLARHFKHVRVFGQRLATASFLTPLAASDHEGLDVLAGDGTRIDRNLPPLPAPIYFVAICSNDTAIEHRDVTSVYLDPHCDLFELLDNERVQEIKRSQDHAANLDREIRQTREKYEKEIRRLTQELQTRRKAIAERDATLALRQRYVTELEVRLRSSMETERHAHTQLAKHAALVDELLRESKEPAGADGRATSGPERLSRLFKAKNPMPEPPPEFKGNLDYPQRHVTYSTRIEVFGWVYSSTTRIKFIQAFLDSVYLGLVTYGVNRPDVVAALPSEAPLGCGYKEEFTLNTFDLAGDRTFSVVIYDDKGNSQTYKQTISIKREAISTVATATEPAESGTAPSHTSMADAFQPVIAEFQTRFGRVPTLLDWTSHLFLAETLPSLAVGTPSDNDPDTLPHIDQSIDIVVVSGLNPTRIAEAKRVASAAVVTISTEGNGTSPGFHVEWQPQHSYTSIPPTVSIIIPVYNKSDYTRKCLERLQETLPADFRGEILVIDDASSDDTQSLAADWSKDARIRCVRNHENLGFLRSCNRGAELATGEMLVFLNNDTLPAPGWLPPLIRILQERPNAGVVGGKLVYPDGRLQEAGGMVFSDGSACNFGKRDRPDRPAYNYVREVDYCSGAVLATPRALFQQLGGFDLRYAPAYYEDTDYCFAVRKAGRKVYYQPETVIVHFEGVSSGTDTSSGVKRYQDINRTKFSEKWSSVLSKQPPPPTDYELTTLQRISARDQEEVDAVHAQ